MTRIILIGAEPPVIDVPDDWDDLWYEPAGVVSTGCDDGTIAAQLSVYYYDGDTYVFPEGEAQNAEPYGYRGRQPVGHVLAWYKRSVLG